MALEELLSHEENMKEPRLDDMIEFFENNEHPVSIGVIQRYFRVGYRRAVRAKNQLMELGFE